MTSGHRRGGPEPVLDGRLVEVLEEAKRLGFLGPGPVADHIVHARAYAAAGSADDPSRPALDLGSGGGVPGLVLAAEGGERRWTLVEANQRRCTFLVEAIATLDLEARVEVVGGRAEQVGREPGHRGRYGTVVARGFGRPAVTAECAAPLLAGGGLLLVSEPPEGTAEEQKRWPAAELDRMGLVLSVITAGPPRIAVLQQVSACPERFPRRVGIPAKRALW
ncbi:MAG: class I SAM-dependent methyltransferase [Actinobacteria bacterium]|nr:class I SAM-dependent methyltransferase [Actinomycetota bacterium]